MSEAEIDVFDRNNLRDLARNPLLLFIGLKDAIPLWFRSRRWGHLLISLSAVIAVLAVYALMVFSSQHDDHNRELIAKYKSMAQRLVPMAELSRELTARLDPLQTDQLSVRSNSHSSQTIDQLRLIARRTLRDAPEDQSAIYLSGLIEALHGHQEAGLEKIASIATNDQPGLPQAHAIIAAKLHAQFRQGDLKVKEALLYHLGEAVKWGDVEPRYLSLYAQLAESPRQKEIALEMLGAAASRDPDYFLELAQAAQRAGQETQARLASEKALKHHETMIASGRGRLEDWTATADAYVLLRKFEEARTKLEDALLQPGLDQSKLKYHLSNVLRYEYQWVLSKNSMEEGPRLGLLETAADLCPSNELIAEEVALAVGKGVTIPDRLRELLQYHVREGTATVATYFALANEYVLRERFQEAIASLEMAISKEPDHPVVLNNLALLIARHRPEEIDRASALIRRANLNAPGNMEIVDTWGEILLIAKQPMEAISKLQTSLSANPSRVRTRELLVRACEQADLPDMARVYRERLEELKKGNR